MTPKRSASKAKVDDATAGEAEVHGWKSSKCTDSHLLDLVGKHLLQPRSVIHWRGSAGQSASGQTVVPKFVKAKRFVLKHSSQ